jgi:hypothetical protein
MDSACFGNGGDMAAPVWRGKWRSDWALEGRAYLGGDELTLADIAIGPWIYRLFELGFAEETSVCLADWYRRLSDRSPRAKASRLGQSRVIHTIRARSLPRSRRRCGGRLRIMLS